MTTYIDQKAGVTFPTSITGTDVVVVGKYVTYKKVGNILFLGGCNYNNSSSGTDHWVIASDTLAPLEETAIAICTASGFTFKSYIYTEALNTTSLNNGVRIRTGAWEQRTAGYGLYQMVAIETL